jgi:hypothetical protein
MPYLVRALYFRDPTRNFEVYYRQERLWVTHYVGTHGNPPMRRYALVVLLPSAPARVLVTCLLFE